MLAVSVVPFYGRYITHPSNSLETPPRQAAPAQPANFHAEATQEDFPLQATGQTQGVRWILPIA
ncbi:MAG: hypothetical protein K0S45_649 [Nitrospira sp.]|jgi:hypothetical protein|nr:hypothetical protein [Nitrospira sp.]